MSVRRLSPARPDRAAPTTNPLHLIRPTWRAPLLAWTISRAIIIAAIVISTARLGHHVSPADPSVIHALMPLGAWDSGWYFQIAHHGYAFNSPTLTTVQTNLAFFPLLPMILRVGLLLGANVFIWGFVVCNLAFLAALFGINVLSRGRFGQRTADTATWCIALAPPAVYASMVYTDGIALALAVGAALAAIRGRWALAGACSAAAALSRPPGLIIALLVALIALMAVDVPWPRRFRNAAVGALPGVLALVGFLAWMQIARGSWRLPLLAERAWRRPPLNARILNHVWSSSYAIVARPIERPWTDFVHWMTWSASLRDLVFTIVLVVLLAVLWRSEGTWRSPWAVYATVAVLFPLTGGSVGSMTRYSLIAFPLVWPIAKWANRGGRWRIPVLTTVAVMIDVALAVQLHYAAP